MFTVESKSQLAKLMATENLIIQHQKLRTAKFDPVNRILYLPIWQNMTGFVYDLLCGHEVGHALYTPPQGWHDAVVDKSKPKSYKHFLNVVEDARIEKKIQRRYPGLRSCFKQAYEKFFDEDFFGVAGRNINNLPFIDRLNLFTKSQYTKNITFNDVELDFISEVKNAESWENVVDITDRIFQYSKNEQYELEHQNDFSFSDNQTYDESGDGDPDEYDFDEIEDETENSSGKSKKVSKQSQEKSDDGDESEESETQSGKSDKESDSDKSEEKSDDKENDNKSDDKKEHDDEKSNSINRDKESNESDRDQFVPNCQTDETYRQKENLLLDVKSKDYHYINIPKPILEDIVIPWKRVQEQMTEHWNKVFDIKNYDTQAKRYYYPKVNPTELVNSFKLKNEKYITLLAKEFEMRKAAKSYAKNKISTTGDLNINKLAQYKVDDNIFRKIMTVPKGKKHGLILLLDYSGSMSDKMDGSIEQILVLAMFCRKVNIPFRVYAFGDSVKVYSLDRNIVNNPLAAKTSRPNRSCFTTNADELALKTVQLREYLNNEMTNSEFTKSVRNMILLKQSFDRNSYGVNQLDKPNSEELTNTPLIQGIFAMTEVMKQFKKVNNLDFTSLIIVHDGDADANLNYYDGRYGNSQTYFNEIKDNVIITNKKSKFQYLLGSEKTNNNPSLLTAALRYFRHETKSKIFGFFILENRSYAIKNSLFRRYLDKNGNSVHYDAIKDKIKELRSEKYLQSNIVGYDDFYMLSNDIIIDDEELEIAETASQKTIVKAFIKFNKKRQVNRVLVNKFIQGIAA
jgi:hypothetical protein